MAEPTSSTADIEAIDKALDAAARGPELEAGRAALRIVEERLAAYEHLRTLWRRVPQHIRQQVSYPR